MKLRDEYDKLEGALRKLGVDPESIVNVDDQDDEDGEEEGVYDDDEDEDERGQNSNGSLSHHPQLHGSSRQHQQVDDLLLDELDPLSSLQNRTARLRRHLDILEEVDESLLSSDAGGDDSSSVPPLHPSYPWVQMALPGGGIVSVPLASTSNPRQQGSSSSRATPKAPPPSTSSQIIDLGDSLNHQSNLSSSLSGLGSGSSARIQSPDSVHDNLPSSGAQRGGFGLDGTCSSSLGKPDLLTVNAGEPVTHFNLDQLLEIVQSFQLDTTLAGNEDMASHNLQLALANPPTDSPIVKHSQDGLDLGTSCDCKPCDTLSEVVDSSGNGGEVQPRETHSCPSSPTETDCSSGFSTLRRRSVTLTEKIRTSKDGSKTQVVRQYGCNTSSAKEPQSVTYQQNAFVYINGKMEENQMGSQSFPSLLPITATSPMASTSASMGPGHATLPRSATEAASSNSGGGWTTTSTTKANRNASSSSYRGHIVRLNSIEPNTVMFSTKDYPLLSDITVPEIIDELEKQFEDKLNDLQGVRLVANNVYICLSKKESLQHLTTYGFYVRGIPIKVVDITNDSVVICLTGVPHYITDATITMLVSTFGISIGEVERRFYKGIDTGERFVRLKPRAHTQVPDFVTVGGCKILIRVLNQDEICEPYTLQSAATVRDSEQSTSHPNSSSSTTYRTGTQTGAMSGPKSRAKPGHCNGTVNSPPSSGEVPQPPALSSTCIPFSSCSLTSSRTEMISTGVTGLLSTPVAPPQPPLTSSFRDSNSGADNSSNSSVPASPKIGRSLRSRIGAVISRSPPDKSTSNNTNGHGGSGLNGGGNAAGGGTDEVDFSTNSYMPGESLDIPTLSPPPYKAPSSNGSTSSVVTGASNGHPNSSSTLSRLRGSSSIGETVDTKKASKESSGGGGLASSLRKYTHSQQYKLPKTSDSSNSLTSSMAGGKTSIEAVRDGSNNNNNKRASVVFEEPGSGPTSTRITSKTVNGILRKGSGPGDEIVANADPPRTSSKARRKDHHRKSASKSNRSSKQGPVEGLTENGEDHRSSRSRSNSTKSSSKNNASNNKESSNSDAKKSQKDLALTRDLPWCGCWGNGCL
ncbi:uncharacterized protein LOC131892947 isoform X2 [Tigriopus californicus]|nr:uncharacterized protein LOC131892947 isoform X2 [Tigriopus californicus]XP_059098804.1 uncharacterized protein LOC131892947 isoform X2 [Tigriopus californicus]